MILGTASYLTGRYEQAARAFKQIIRKDRWSHAFIAAAYAKMGCRSEAQIHIEIFRETRIKELVARGIPLPENPLDLASERAKRYRLQTDREHYLLGLQKAGLTGSLTPNET